MNKNKKIFVIAGEASGDILGAGIMRSLISKNKNISFFGIGGEEMSKVQNFKSLFDIGDISVMGIFEILKRIFIIKKRIKQTINEIIKINPEIVITIDSPGFNIEVVKKVKKKLKHTKFIHYVAPQVWAWKEKRAKKISKIFDYLLCFFPFEPQYFEKYGLKCFVVGHPAISNVKGDKNNFYKNYNISKKDTIITLLPGTREQMATKLLPIYSDVVDELYNKIKNLKIVIPTTENMKYFIFQNTRNWKREPIIITGIQNRYDVFFASKVVLAISGTSILELAIAKIPTVVAYKLSNITYIIAKKLVKIKYVTLPNIIMKKEIIPEFIQDKCTPKNLTQAILKCINNEKYRTKYIENLILFNKKIGNEFKNSPSEVAANAILTILAEKK